MEVSKVKVALSISEIEERILWMKDLGWRIKGQKLVSKSGIACTLSYDGTVAFTAPGMQEPIPAGPYKTLAEFIAGIKNQLLFNRYKELDGLSLWDEIKRLHGFMIRGRDEVRQLLRYISPRNYPELFSLYENRFQNGGYVYGTPDDEKFENQLPMSAKNVISFFYEDRTIEDYSWDMIFDLYEALHGKPRNTAKMWEDAQGSGNCTQASRWA